MATSDDMTTQQRLTAVAVNNLAQVITKVFPNSGGTAATATAGAATLPANPVKFVIVTLPDGTTGKIPLYGL